MKTIYKDVEYICSFNFYDEVWYTAGNTHKEARKNMWSLIFGLVREELIHPL